MHFVADRDSFLPKQDVGSMYPSYFRTRTFDRFSPAVYGFDNREMAAKALQLCRLYADNVDRIIAERNGGGLYFHSATKGSGKTFLSTILGNELIKRGKRVLWYSMPNLLQEVKNSYDRESGTSTAEVLNKIRNAPILILDDIGVERQTSWVNETVFSFLDHRMATCKPTLFTSNHLPDELAYDERIIDRIRNMSTIVPLPEVNVRRRLATQNDLNTFLGA